MKKYNHTENKPVAKAPASSSPVFREARKTLEDQLRTKVDIRGNTKGQGTIVIKFKSEDEFERIINLLGRE